MFVPAFPCVDVGARMCRMSMRVSSSWVFCLLGHILDGCSAQEKQSTVHLTNIIRVMTLIPAPVIPAHMSTLLAFFHHTIMPLASTSSFHPRILKQFAFEFTWPEINLRLSLHDPKAQVVYQGVLPCRF